MNPKIPSTQYNIASNIINRWSARAFSPKKIEENVLFELLEAATWAPSSSNEQPWKYLYAYNGTPAFEKLHSLLMGGNQPWCKNANVLIVSIARKNFEKTGQPNRHYMYDVGAANQNLLLQAQQHGIFGHVLGGYHHAQATESLQIPENEEIACFIALGYLDSPETLEEPFKSRELSPRVRKSVKEVVVSL